MKTKEVKDRLRASTPLPAVDWSKGLSSGSTLLNLACSGRPTVGYVPGSFCLLVGDSASGKTWLALSAFAEACRNKHYDKHRLIFDNAENGALMDLARYFGKTVRERLKSPNPASIGLTCSTTVEEFYFNVERCLKDGPCLYVLDSMDALTTEDERDKFTEVRKAREKGRDTSGSYGTSKAKLNSSYLRVVFNRLRETGSILIVLSQTRANIGFGSQFNPKTRGGGLALTFYASLELWTSIRGHLKKRVGVKNRELGIVCQARVKKNRLAGRVRTVEFPIYHSHGIDDVGSCIEYMIEEGRWSKEGSAVVAPEFDFKGTEEKLVQWIEENGKEKQLGLLTADTWREVEEQCAIKRKPRYI